MDNHNALEPRLRSANARHDGWGLFSRIENSWSHLTFPTRAAAEEAATVLARAGLL